MFSRRACSESGPHPSIPGSGPVGSGHLWGKRNQGRTSAPVVGDAKQPAIILKTRRSWPVAPIQCRSYRRVHTRSAYQEIFDENRRPQASTFFMKLSDLFL
ncbi:hypothetical protein HZH68_007863 [Vespula germanica]|uniref:Uncharacterized protein n=1 Tax=Vespula germanica TaxID=30212 RepID=A0A834K8G2_VESGE|nr:hypothetical protein HZH68_007863 [Vespula germanica]